jgi:hypothetical protein
MMLLFSTSRKTVSARQEHSCVTNLKGDADLLSNVEALSEDGELIEPEVSAHVGHAISDTIHKPTRTARWAAVRFEAEGVDASAEVLHALLVVGPVGELSLRLVPGNVSGASGADNCDVKGNGARVSEVVHYDVAGASVVSGDEASYLMVDNYAGGSEEASESVDDVVVALMGEARRGARGLVSAVGVVGVTAVAAMGGAIDNSQSKLDNFLKELVRYLSAEVLVGDRKVNGARDETSRALDTRLSGMRR